MTPIRAHRSHFFQLLIRKEKRDILGEKRDDAKKSVSLRPKAVMLTPMQYIKTLYSVINDASFMQ